MLGVASDVVTIVTFAKDAFKVVNNTEHGEVPSPDVSFSKGHKNVHDYESGGPSKNCRRKR